MVTKEDLERLLSKYYVVDPPKHAFMLDKRTVGISDGVNFFRGLSPKWRNDVILLTPDANDETILHEAIHAEYGTEELVTDRLAKLLMRKQQVLGMFPNVKNILPSREVHYEQCPGCPLCEDLSKLLVHKPAGARPQHYVLKP